MRKLRRLLLTAAVATALTSVFASPAKAACDPVTLHGSGCTQSIRCLPAAVGEPCL